MCATSTCFEYPHSSQLVSTPLSFSEWRISLAFARMFPYTRERWFIKFSRSPILVFRKFSFRHSLQNMDFTCIWRPHEQIDTFLGGFLKVRFSFAAHFFEQNALPVSVSLDFFLKNPKPHARHVSSHSFSGSLPNLSMVEHITLHDLLSRSGL